MNITVNGDVCVRERTIEVQFPGLDSLDEQILRLLREDGRMSNAEIGRRLNVSRVTVRERVNRLIERDVIRKFTIVINPRAAGKRSSIFLDIEVKPGSLVAIAEHLAKSPNMVSIYQMTGASVLHCHALLDENEQLNDYLQEVIYPLEGVVRVMSKIVLTRFKERDGLLV